MVDDNPFAGLKGVVVKPSDPEQLKKQIQELKKQSIDIDNDGQIVGGVMHLLTEEYSHNLDDAQNKVFSKINAAFFDGEGFVKKLDDVVEKIEESEDTATITELIKEQKNIVNQMRKDLSEAGAVCGVDVETMIIKEKQLQENTEQKEQDALNDAIAQALKEATDEFENKGGDDKKEKKDEIEFKTYDEASNAFAVLMQEMEKYKNDKELYDFAKKRFAHMKNRKANIDEIKNSKKQQKALDILLVDIAVMMRDIEEESARHLESKEADKKVIDDIIEEYEPIANDIPKKYAKNKRIEAIIKQANNTIKKNRGVVNINNPKTRAKKVEGLKKNIKTFIEQIREEMQKTDNFLDMVKEFGRTGTVYQDRNNASNEIKIISYDGNDEGYVKYEDDKGAHVVSTDKFRDVVAQMKKKNELITLNEDAYGEILKTVRTGYKKDKKLQNFVNNVDKSVKQKKNEVKKIKNVKTKNKKLQELQIYINAVTLQIADRIDTIETENDNKKDISEEKLRQKQEKREERFAKFYGNNSIYIQYANKIQEYFPTDGFEIVDYEVGEYPRDDRVTIDHNGEKKVFTMKKFKKFIKDGGYVKDIGEQVKGQDQGETNFIGGVQKINNRENNNNLQDFTTEEQEAVERILNDVENYKLFKKIINNSQGDIEEFWNNIGINLREEHQIDTGQILKLVDAVKQEFENRYDEEIQSVIADKPEEQGGDGVSTGFEGKKEVGDEFEINLEDLIGGEGGELFSGIEDEQIDSEADNSKGVVDHMSEIEKDFGVENMKILLERVDSFYHRVKDGADWEEFDDLEREEILEDLTEKFIMDVVSMIDSEYAQQFTKEDTREVFRNLLSLE